MRDPPRAGGRAHLTSLPKFLYLMWAWKKDDVPGCGLVVCLVLLRLVFVFLLTVI